MKNEICSLLEQYSLDPVVRCIDCGIPEQPREVYYGNREYKRHLLFPNMQSMQKKSTQLLFRLNEGNGRALYLIGVEDCGQVTGISENEMLMSIDNFIQMSQIVKCRVEKINVYRLAVDNDVSMAYRYIAAIRISRQKDQSRIQLFTDEEL